MTYIVKSGDTLFELAEKFYGDGWQYYRIVDANPSITNPDLIRVGDILTIPGVSTTPVPTTTIPTTTTTTTTTSAASAISKQVILLAVLAAALAAGFWYTNQKKAEE